MNTYELILLTLLNQNEQMIAGRTLFQKTIYFLNIKMNLGINFEAYYYGPYSSEISDEISSLASSGIISECIETYPSYSFGVSFEPRKYTYKLTELGAKMAAIVKEKHRAESVMIQSILDRMKNAGAADDYKSLSIAAKMYHILKAKERAKPSQILAEAKELGWTISEEDANASIEFLKKMELAKVDSSGI